MAETMGWGILGNALIASKCVVPAIALDSDQVGTFTNDQWVQVEGTFDLQLINGKSVPMVSMPLIKPVEAPAVPYLF